MLLLGEVASAQQAASPYRPMPPGPLPAALTGAPAPVAQAPAMEVPPVLPIRFQPPTGTPYDQPGEYVIQLEPPGLERLSRLDSDTALQARIFQETLTRSGGKEKDVFPPSPILSRDKYAGRGNLWQARVETVEPNFTVFHHLYFEDRNAERYGWDFGPLQTLLSATLFGVDVALLPMHLSQNWFDNDDCSTGYCLPGDPVPYLIYPPVVTVRGVVAELGAISALIAIFP